MNVWQNVYSWYFLASISHASHSVGHCNYLFNDSSRQVGKNLKLVKCQCVIINVVAYWYGWCWVGLLQWILILKAFMFRLDERTSSYNALKTNHSNLKLRETGLYNAINLQATVKTVNVSFCSSWSLDSPQKCPHIGCELTRVGSLYMHFSLVVCSLKKSSLHFEVVGSKLSGLKRRRPMSTAFTGSFTEETLVANSCSMSSGSSYRGPLRPLGTLLSHVNIPHGWPFRAPLTTLK